MLNTLKTSLLMVFLLVSFPLVAKDVFRSVDENGRVIFTDAPEGPSEKVEIKEPNTVKSPPKPQSRLLAGGGEEGKTEAEQSEVEYELLAIVRPTDGDVFQRNDQEFIDVFIISEPVAMGEGHVLKVWVNGELQENASRQFSLQTPFRGSYTIEAAIFDEDDNELISAQSVSFVVFQPSVLNPNHPKNKKKP